MNGFFSNPDELDSLGNNLAGIAEDLASEIGAFQRNIESLLKIWHGDSADEFLNQYNIEKGRLEALKGKLAAKANALRINSRNQADVEAELTNNISNMSD